MRRNIELTQGVIFSQRVLLALINKGVGREEAYKMVQDSAMKAWEEKKDFLSLLEADRRITAHLSKKELKSLFDYNYYLKHVDEVFERLGLSKARKRAELAEIKSLAPRAI
jgi:adenylosuccinate lyase